MKRKKIVAANWKMNTVYSEALTLLRQINQQSQDVTDVVKVVFPPFTFIHALVKEIETEKNIFIGAQNCSEHEKGAYTGEVSCSMLQSVGAQYVLVGHSERRSYFQEDSSMLIQKISQALSQNLNVIFCFGEQLTDRKSNNHFEKVKSQLREVLNSYPKEKVSNLVLAYEPVWAIGTGENASPEQAQEMHAFVRKEISEIFDNQIAQNTSILYGGSCNGQNAGDLFSCEDVDGGLIGGASLKAEEFSKIIHAF